MTFTLKLDLKHPYLEGRGVTPELAAAFGVGYCARGMMGGRIAIPIHDAAGNLVAYAGRWPGEPPAGEERYKLPVGFKKSLVLYNLHRLKYSEEVVLVEGYWSVMRLYDLGVPAVALMGRSLSPQQEELLVSAGVKRGVKRLVLLLDGDVPGRQAAAELLPRLARRFFVRLVEPPDDAQPDTISPETLRELLRD